MNAILKLIRSSPIVSFAVLACFFGWILYIAAALGADLAPLNIPLAPILAAAIVAAAMGRAGWNVWTRTLRTLRTSLGWYVLAIGAPAVVISAAVLANGVFGAPIPTPSQLSAWTELPVTFLFLLLFIGIGEEAGWTAFAAPHLLTHYSYMVAWGVLTAIRIIWHLPLMLSGDLPWVLGVGGNAAFQFLLLWIFLRSGGVWLLAAIWHAVLNTLGGEFLFQMVQGANQARLGLLMTAGYVLLAAIVFLTDRRHLRLRLQPAASTSSR